MQRKMAGGSRVTIRDIAEHLGVATSTVSRALQDHPRISAKTKQRVLKAARDLNYHGTRRACEEPTRTIGIILPHSPDELLLHPFFPLVMRGVSRYAQPRGYMTSYAFADNEEDRLDLVKQFIASSSIEGLILSSVRTQDRCVQFLADDNVPFAVVGRPDKPGDVLWVDNDNVRAMYEVVVRLIHAGYRRIAIIAGPDELNVTQTRLEGYRTALADSGLDLDLSLIAHATTFSESAGYLAMAGVLGRTTPDAFVATDDLLGLGAMNALADCNVGPLPCVGFNNSRPAREHDPPMASVDVHPEQLGHHAARLLIARIEHIELSERHVIVPTLFVGRDTSDPVSA